MTIKGVVKTALTDKELFGFQRLIGQWNSAADASLSSHSLFLRFTKIELR